MEGNAMWRRFISMGDSLTAGIGDYGTDWRPVGWARRLSQFLDLLVGPCWYTNIAVSGSVVDDVIDRQIGQVVLREPNLSSLTIGMNDIQRRYFPEDEFTAKFSKVVHRATLGYPQLLTCTYPETTAIRLAYAHSRVVNGQVVWVPDEEDAALLMGRCLKLNDIIRKVAADNGALMLDLAQIFQGVDLGSDNADVLFSADGFHPNAEGHKLWATLAAELLLKNRPT